MKYLKTYQENTDNVIIEQIPVVNNHLINIIIKHYNITQPELYGIPELCATLNIKKIYMTIYNSFKECYIIWNQMSDFYENENANAITMTINDWLKTYYPDLTLDEIIQSNKLGLL